MAALVLKHGKRCILTEFPPAAVAKHAPRFRAQMQELARVFIERANQAQLKHIERHEAALEYWVGAGVCARMCGHSDLAEAIAKIGALDIAARGYAAIIDLAQ